MRLLESEVGSDDAGRAMRNERYFPAYVLVVEPFETEGKMVGLDNDRFELLLSLDGRSGVARADDDDDGRFGRDEVRSMPLLCCSLTGDWLPTEDSVLERPSMRFASLVGVMEGDLFPGDMESNIPERSRTSFDGVPEGVPYVRDTQGFTGVGDSSTSVSVSAPFSVLVGDGVRNAGPSETFLRFEVSCPSEDTFRLTLGLFPYVRRVPDDADIDMK